MTFEEYQKESAKTAKYGTSLPPVVYVTLGLTGEAGEVAEMIKKIYRDKQGVFSDQDKEMITKELGDVLWYIANMSRELGIPLEQVAKKNLEKLFSRMDRGVLGGSGNDR